MKVVDLEDEVQVVEEVIKKEQMFNVRFREYGEKTYENFNINPFSMVSFEPIASFVASRFGVSSK